MTRANPTVGTADVKAVYDGVQARLYELFMGQQIHVGGLRSSIELADAAGIGSGQRGVELCCGSGASMRFLVAMRGVASMLGIELSDAAVERGHQANADQHTSDRIRFVVGDATASDLPGGVADFVWSEDAWCYVPDKDGIIAEAVRLIRPGGVIAFTDWTEGPARLSDEEADHVMSIMSFPSLQDVDGYRMLLERHGCDVIRAEDTGRFGPSFELYAEMLRSQLTFDALELFGFSEEVFDTVVEELVGLSRLGHDRKLIQARFVARKR